MSGNEVELQLKLEEQILGCWNIIDDLKTTFHAEKLYEDENEMMNVLLGLISLYTIKFENLFTTYEVFLEEFYEMKTKKETEEFEQLKLFSKFPESERLYNK
jgi:hypothetical protein